MLIDALAPIDCRAASISPCQVGGRVASPGMLPNHEIDYRQIQRQRRLQALAESLLRVSRVVRQSSDGRYHREADPESSAIAIQRAGKIDNLAATRRYDAPTQQADVIGDGQTSRIVDWSRTANV
jgi:hypothetical protein